MNNRFSLLNNEPNQNIFKTATKYHSKKSVSGNSLKELIEKSKNERQGIKQKNDKYYKKNQDNSFKSSKPMTPKKEEFKIVKEEFPILSENTKTIDDKRIDADYKDKIKKVKEEKKELDKSKKLQGWTYLTPQYLKHQSKNNSNENNISPYYNPTQSIKILVDREEYREELNDILGDISPYWITYEQDDTEPSEYDETSEIEDDDQEYVEDW